MGEVRAIIAAMVLAVGSLFLSGPAVSSENAPAYTWQTVPFGGGGFVSGLVYHPRQKDILYARTDIGGLYRFDFESKSWFPLLDHLDRADGDLMGVLAIALDPANPERVYAATGLYMGDWARKGAILRSDDRGKSWSKTDLPIHIGGNADGRGTGERLVVDPRNSEVLYYASNQDGIWKSSDGGKSFARTRASQKSLSFIAVDPQDSKTLWAGTSDGHGGLIISRDGGQSFTVVAETPDMVPQHAVFAKEGALYVTFSQNDGGAVVNPNNAMAGAVWKRDAASAKWKDITPAPPMPNLSGGYSGIDVSGDGTVAVSTLDRWYPGDDIYVSHDKGAHWTGLSERARHIPTGYPWLVNFLKGEDRMGHWISDLKFNPFNADEMVYGTGYGVWMSRNFATATDKQTVDFDFAVRNLEETATLQMVSPTGGATVLAAMGDVSGAAWDDLTQSPASGLFKPSNETNFSIDFAGLKPGNLVRTAANSGTQGYYSRNGGADWVPFAASPFKAPAKGEAWRGPGSIAISAGASALLWVPEKVGAHYSVDGGKSWSASTGWPSQTERPILPVADKAADGLFYAFDPVTSSIVASGDRGASFTEIVGGLPKVESWQNAQLAVAPGRVRDLWLAAPYGLLHSPDSKSPMKQIDNVAEAWLISFGAPATAEAYPSIFLWGQVKGAEGLWRSDDSGKNWVRINDSAHQFGHIKAIAGDPLEHGTVYIAPHGRGILAGKAAGTKIVTQTVAAQKPVAVDSRSIAIDIAKTTGPVDRFFDLSVGSDYPGTLIRPENMGQLKTTVDELGFRYVRFHDIFHDVLGTVKIVDGETVYDWSKIDQLYDGLKARRIKPFIELGFTPSAMKTSEQTIFYWNGNTSHPKPDAWKALIDGFVRHLQTRYGKEEVRTWFFEVWNEPNLEGFWEKADQKAYFDLYVSTANTIKAIDPALRVGGPSTAGAAWVPEFLNHVSKSGSSVDFVSHIPMV